MLFVILSGKFDQIQRNNRIMVWELDRHEIPAVMYIAPYIGKQKVKPVQCLTALNLAAHKIKKSRSG